MSDFVIMVDATSDLTEETREKYGIVEVPSHITLPDGKEISSFHRWEQFGRDEFYNALKANPDGYTTAPPNVEEFTRALEAQVSQGREVLVITISSGISGTFQFAEGARKNITEKYPDARVRCVDSLRFGPGFGLIALYASQLRAAGKNMEETADIIERDKNRFHQAGWLDDLSFVAKKGRMTHAKAFFGTLAGIKPIGEFDYNGMTTVIGKAKGAKAAYDALIKYIEATIEKPEEQIILVAHTNRLAQAEAYAKMIEERFHPKQVMISDVFPMCGISIGPGLMAAYYQGKPISEGLAEERAILEKVTGKGNA